MNTQPRSLFSLAISCKMAFAFGTAAFAAPEEIDIPAPDPGEAMVPEGYRVEVAMKDLTFPTSIEFDERGRMLVAESGYAYGAGNVEARIYRIDEEGQRSIVATKGLAGPINDLLWHDGRLLISHRSKISVLTESGVTDLVTGLPSEGDHHNNQLTAGPDGKIYFGQGTYTNSGVVGPDNYKMGWLKEHPELHDVPARDIVLRKRVFESENVLEGTDRTARTMAFHPFGVAAEETVVSGRTKASGTILKMNPDGSDLEVHAWGLRNPYGVLWLPDGRLYATENGMDVRGSRPVANDSEDLYLVKEGAWYGWPDFAQGMPVTDPRFKPEDGPEPSFLMAEHPSVEEPIMTFPQHSAVAKLAWCDSEEFGRPNKLFVAFFGHMSPMTGTTEKHGGHRVAAIDLEGKDVETFFTRGSHGNSGHEGQEEHAGSSEAHAKSKDGHQHAPGQSAGPRRLLDVQFGPDGALYVVDFGVLRVSKSGLEPKEGTGVVWRISRAQ